MEGGGFSKMIGRKRVSVEKLSRGTFSNLTTGSKPQWFLYMDKREKTKREKGIGREGCRELVKEGVNG